MKLVTVVLLAFFLVLLVLKLDSGPRLLEYYAEQGLWDLYFIHSLGGGILQVFTVILVLFTLWYVAAQWFYMRGIGRIRTWEPTLGRWRPEKLPYEGHSVEDDLGKSPPLWHYILLIILAFIVVPALLYYLIVPSLM